MEKQYRENKMKQAGGDRLNCSEIVEEHTVVLSNGIHEVKSKYAHTVDVGTHTSVSVKKFGIFLEFILFSKHLS